MRNKLCVELELREIWVIVRNWNWQRATMFMMIWRGFEENISLFWSARRGEIELRGMSWFPYLSRPNRVASISYKSDQVSVLYQRPRSCHMAQCSWTSLQLNIIAAERQCLPAAPLQLSCQMHSMKMCHFIGNSFFFIVVIGKRLAAESSGQWKSSSLQSTYPVEHMNL